VDLIEDLSGRIDSDVPDVTEAVDRDRDLPRVTPIARRPCAPATVAWIVDPDRITQQEHAIGGLDLTRALTLLRDAGDVLPVTVEAADLMRPGFEHEDLTISALHQPPDVGEDCRGAVIASDAELLDELPLGRLVSGRRTRDGETGKQECGATSLHAAPWQSSVVLRVIAIVASLTAARP
jgi:hypothetical protein